MKYFDIKLVDSELIKIPVRVVKRAALTQAINSNISNEQLNQLIAQYILFDDEYRKAAQKWYEQHLLVETLDPEEVRFTRTNIDDNGNETIEQLPNAYEIATTNRNELETQYDWLKGYRGIEAPERPPFIVDVEQWKAANISYRDERQKDYIKEISQEGTFEKTVGDTLGALLKFASVTIKHLPESTLSTDEIKELSLLIDKVNDIKLKHPKKPKG